MFSFNLKSYPHLRAGKYIFLVNWNTHFRNIPNFAHRLQKKWHTYGIEIWQICRSIFHLCVLQFSLILKKNRLKNLVIKKSARTYDRDCIRLLKIGERIKHLLLFFSGGATNVVQNKSVMQYCRIIIFKIVAYGKPTFSPKDISILGKKPNDIVHHKLCFFKRFFLQQLFYQNLVKNKIKSHAKLLENL